MKESFPLFDPLWRAVWRRSAAAACLVALVGSLGLGWSLPAAFLAALWLATAAVRHAEPLRREVGELAGGARDGAGRPEPSFAELARRVAEARGRQAEERRRVELERDEVLGILGATSEGILVVGGGRRIEMINDAARRILEPPLDPLGRPLHEVVRERDLLDFVEAFGRGEDPLARRIQIHPPGGPRWLHLTGTRIGARGAGDRTVLVLHDLTDLQHLERVRTDFVANVTHEMRSPLASILGYAETLAEEDAPLTAEARDFVERILRNSRRLEGIIRDLIALSRLEHATQAQVEPCDVRALLEALREAFNDAARAKDIALACEARDLPPSLEIDGDLVRQALANLVDNALKYTSPGGRVALRARLAAQGPAPAEALLELVVADTGPGIPPEHQGRIFERFYRVDPARSRSLGGTGLGLAIVKHTVALHGGTVQLESEPGHGASFRLRIPCARPEGRA